MAKFSPLHDRILVRRVEEATTTRGGIIIPDSAKDKPQEGEVISTGKGRTNDEGKTFPLAVKEGDRIEKDQPLLELENEKAVATIPSTSSGVVSKIYVKNGDRISVGALTHSSPGLDLGLDVVPGS